MESLAANYLEQFESSPRLQTPEPLRIILLDFSLTAACMKMRVIFHTDYGGSVHLYNVGLLRDYTAL
jgi:hypothetical protein